MSEREERIREAFATILRSWWPGDDVTKELDQLMRTLKAAAPPPKRNAARYREYMRTYMSGYNKRKRAEAKASA